MNPYAWQIRALKEWEESNYRGIFDVVTGAGKTYLALMAIDLLYEKSEDGIYVQVVVPTRVLMEQWVRILREHFPQEKKIGRIFGGCKDSEGLRFQVYVVNSARDCITVRRNRLIGDGKRVLLIADECHHYGSVCNRRIFEDVPEGVGEFYTLGLSSTPHSPVSDAVLRDGLGPVVFRYDHQAAVKEKVLADFCIYQIETGFTGQEKEKYAELSFSLTAAYARLIKSHGELKGLDRDAFFGCVEKLAAGDDVPAMAYRMLVLKRRELALLSDTRYSCALELLACIDEDARVILFCERISQADTMSEMLNDICPGQVSKVHSGMDRTVSDGSLREFKGGEHRILVACRALDEGIDVPDADIAIVLSGSAAKRQRIQRLGRILRRNSGGKLSALYYIYLRESPESQIFLNLPEDTAFVMPCRYWKEEHSFSNMYYEDRAMEVMDELRKKKIGQKQMTEIRRCIEKGIMRPDWLRSAEYCEKMIEKNNRDKNYWICMRML